MSRHRRGATTTISEREFCSPYSLQSLSTQSLRELASPSNRHTEHGDCGPASRSAWQCLDRYLVAGANLDQAIQSPDTVVQNEAATEADNGSEPNLDTDLETDLEAGLGPAPTLGSSD